MEILLFVLAAFNISYYLLLVILTDMSWFIQIYWVVSALIFFALGMILRIDRKRFLQHKWHLPLELRTFISATFGLFCFLFIAAAVTVLLPRKTVDPEMIDYMVMIESADVTNRMTDSDFDSLDEMISVMNDHPDVRIVLAGANRYRDIEVDEGLVQNQMKNYLILSGISEDRIITENISDNLRQNIVYSYAYILVDWYSRGYTSEQSPKVVVVTDRVSVLRVQMALDRMGSSMGILSYPLGILTLPYRLVEEIRYDLAYYLSW